MKKIHFLAKVIGSEALEINNTNIHSLPAGHVSEKRVEFVNSRPKLGDLIYVYNAEIDKEKKVIVQEYTILPCGLPKSISEEVSSSKVKSTTPLGKSIFKDSYVDTEDTAKSAINSSSCYPWEVPPRR